MIELVKGTLLYADTVEVLSMSNQVVRDLNKSGSGDHNNLSAVFDFVDDDTARRPG